MHTHTHIPLGTAGAITGIQSCLCDLCAASWQPLLQKYARAHLQQRLNFVKPSCLFSHLSHVIHINAAWRTCVCVCVFGSCHTCQRGMTHVRVCVCVWVMSPMSTRHDAHACVSVCVCMSVGCIHTYLVMLCSIHPIFLLHWLEHTCVYSLPPSLPRTLARWPAQSFRLFLYSLSLSHSLSFHTTESSLNRFV